MCPLVWAPRNVLCPLTEFFLCPKCSLPIFSFNETFWRQARRPCDRFLEAPSSIWRPPRFESGLEGGNPLSHSFSLPFRPPSVSLPSLSKLKPKLPPSPSALSSLLPSPESWILRTLEEEVKPNPQTSFMFGRGGREWDGTTLRDHYLSTDHKRITADLNRPLFFFVFLRCSFFLVVSFHLVSSHFSLSLRGVVTSGCRVSVRCMVS